jgi:predicted transcriptional regulator
METLMNFRVPEDLKRKFQNLCTERKSTMTTEIVRFILDYVGNTSGKTNSNTWGGKHAR